MKLNLKQERKQKILILVFVILSFLSLIMLRILTDYRSTTYNESAVQSLFQTGLSKQDNIIDSIFLLPSSKIKDIQEQPYIEGNLVIISFSDEKLQHCNVSYFSFNDINSIQYSNSAIIKLNNTYYYHKWQNKINEHHEEYHILLPILKNSNKEENIYLSTILDQNIIAQQLSIKEIDTTNNSLYTIYNLHNEPILAIDFLNDQYIKSTNWQLALLIVFTISFLCSIMLIGYLWMNFHIISGLFIQLSVLILGYFIHQNIESIVAPFNNSILFSSSFLSSNNYFNNLYQLFYILISIGIFCHSLLSIFSRFNAEINLNKYNILVRWFIYIAAAAAISYLIFELNIQVLQTVVFDSKITLVVDNIQYINFTSLLGTSIIIYCIIISIILIYVTRLIGELCQFNKFQHYASFLIIEIILCSYISNFEFSTLFVQGFITKIIIYLLITIIPPPFKIRGRKINNLSWQIWFLIISIYGVATITILDNVRENEFRKYYALNNFKKQSIKFEYQFAEIIESLKNDTVIINYQPENKIKIGRYIKDTYLPKLHTELFINISVIKQLPEDAIVDTLLFSDNLSNLNSYYYILKREDDYLQINTTIKDVFYYKKNKIDNEIITKASYSDFQYLTKYRTAKYQNNELMMFDGIKNTSKKLPNNIIQKLDDNNTYIHNTLNTSTLYQYNEDLSQCITVIYQRNLLMQIITSLSTILLLLLLSILALYLYQYVFTTKKNILGLNNWHLNLNSKINFAFIVTILISFIIVGIMVYYMITSSNKSSFNDEQVKNSAITETFLANTKNLSLPDLNVLSEKFNIIALFYDTTGVLKGNYIDIAANEYLNNKFILTPNVIKSVINSPNYQITEIINKGITPHIATVSKIQLDQEDVFVKIFDYNSVPSVGENTSDIILGIFNILILVIFFASIVTYFIVKTSTKPIKIISQKFKEISLKHNEPISWPYNDEFEPLVKEYNTMIQTVEELAQKLSNQERENLWREVAQQVAHEIKNPLTPMRLNIQYLERAIADNRPNVEELTKKVCGVILEQIETLNRIASEFSTLAKLDTQYPENINIQEILHSVCQLFRANEQITIKMNCVRNDVQVYMDKSYLIRSLTNIIKNAIQAIPEDRDKLIKVSCNATNTTIEILITDNGNGISPEIEDKLFTPYFTSKSTGTGIGLNMTKKMIEVSGGTIDYTTTQNIGTTFIITLPIYNTK